jgi:hypothetical protein
MIRSQLFSRFPIDKKEYYFLRRARLKKSNTLDPLICCSEDKGWIFDLLKLYESEGVACYVEDREGKRLS